MTVVQMLPALQGGGVEKGTLEVARHLVQRGHRSIVISAGGRLVEQLEREGSRHLAWDVGAKRLRTLRWVGRLRRFLQETRPDILHLRSRLPAWIGWWAWKGLPPGQRPHLVTTVHGRYSVGRYSAVMTRGETVIAVSEMIRDYVLDNYPEVDPQRVRVIHRGVDPAAYPHSYRPPPEWLAAWRRQFPGLEGKYLITLPGRLTRLKGQEHLIDVVAELRRRDLPVHGLMVGGADPQKRRYEEELRERIRQDGLQQDITLTGHRGDLREIMAVSDVVLSLSLEPEAFGRTTLEALSLGRPVAAYDHGGVAEQLAVILPQGRVAVADRQAMAALLAEWRRSPPAVPRHQPFTLEKMLDQTLAVYTELVLT
ncbi:MAG: glycosyltransferase family 4 protein [Pseudomonadota bacterium]|nr:glycosyltransferase family 4 protein [Pseudomonadota bacterium]